MNRKRVLLAILLTTFSLVVGTGAIFINGPGHSRAAGTVSYAKENSTSLHSSAVVQGGVYYGVNSASAYALNANTGKVIWHYPVVSSISPFLLSVSNGIVYFETNDTVYALNASNGMLHWQFHSSRFVLAWSPAIVNGIIYLSAPYGVVALDASTGSRLWRLPSTAYVNPGVVVNGAAYFVAGDNAVHAVNTTTGSQLWSYSIGAAGGSIQTAVNGVVYFITGTVYPTIDASVYALEATTGSLLWHYVLLNTRIGAGGFLKVINGLAYTFPYFGHGLSSLIVLDAQTGSVLWQQQIGYLISFTLVNGVFYYSNGSSVFALDHKTGKLFWSYPSNPSPAISPGDLVVVNNIVYVGSYYNGSTFALDASSGALLWNYKPTGLGSLLLVANGTIYVGGGDYVYAVEGDNGALLWSHYFAHYVISIPMMVNGIVYVDTTMSVHAFNTSNGTQLWHYPI